MAERTDHMQNLLRSFNRILEGEKIVNKAFLEQTAHIARIASKGDIDVEEVTTLLKRAYSSDNKYLVLYAVNSLVLVLGTRNLQIADLRIIIAGLINNRHDLSFGGFPEWEPGVTLLSGPPISIDEAVSNLAKGNPEALSSIMCNICSGQCYDDEIRYCLITYQQTRDKEMFSFLLSQLIRFFTEKNLCYGQASTATTLLRALCSEPRDSAPLYERLLLLLNQLKPGSSQRQDIERAIALTKHEEFLPYLLIAFREDRTAQPDLGFSRDLASKVSGRENERQDSLLASFPASLTRHVRRVFKELCVLDRLAERSDRERQKIRERCALAVLDVFRMRRSLLIPFVARFCRTERGKSDLVYLLSRLPQKEGELFLEECGRCDPDDEDIVVTLALASS